MLAGRRDPEGRLDVTTDAVGVDTTLVGGVAINDVGQVHIIGSAPEVYANGFGLMNDGRLCMGTGAIDFYREGLPFMATGQLRGQTDTVPDPDDPYVGGIRVGPLGGVYTTLIPPPIGDAPVLTDPPEITGVGAVGETLTATTGTWESLTPLTYTYRWYQDTTPIIGAINATYIVQSGDYNHGIRCYITARNDVGAVQAVSNNISILTP